jgi:hypothetical protein
MAIAEQVGGEVRQYQVQEVDDEIAAESGHPLTVAGRFQTSLKPSSCRKNHSFNLFKKSSPSIPTSISKRCLNDHLVVQAYRIPL